MDKYILSIFLPIIFLISAIRVTAQPAIVPAPASMTLVSEVYVPLQNLTLCCDDPAAIIWSKRHLEEWFGDLAPEVRKGKGISAIEYDEGYALTIDDNGVRIDAKTLQGVRYALYSLRQVAMPKRGTLKVDGWIVPCMSVSDWPRSRFRGIHICWFRETKAWEVERMIRLAAYYKMNYAVIEPWGTFKSETAPWYCWPDAKMTGEEISRLKGIADDLGITLIPQLNIFGHAAAARNCGGKHVVFSVNPEYQPLFEPDNGWNWCLTNPETRRVIIDMLKELHEDFGHPPFIHIGGDEALEPSCPECLKRPYDEILLEHLNAVDKAIADMGARPMMWHDMLIQRGDPRWKGFYANGTEATAKVTRTLPKDIVICDWFYGEPKDSYPTMSYFHDLGFSVLTTPWNNYEGMVPQIKFNQEHDMFGVLGTVWHHFYGWDFEGIFYNTAMMAWHGALPDVKNRHEKFLTHLHHVCWDMKATDMEMFGLYHYDVQNGPTAD